MRTTDRIGFKLIIKEPYTAERTIVVCPRYEGLKMKWQRESGKVYHTLDFEGNLEFWGVDFVTLLNCQLRTVFELVVFLKGRGEVGRSEFRKTDCEWNLNDGWCKVDISTYDKYSKINDHKDDEFNLVKLGLPKKSINLYHYPQNQVYFQEDVKINLFGISGGGTQVSVTQTHDVLSLINMHFSHGVVAGMCSYRDIQDRFVTFKGTVDDFSTNIAGYKCLHIYGALYIAYDGNASGGWPPAYKFKFLTDYRNLIPSPAQRVFTSEGFRYDSLYGFTGATVKMVTGIDGNLEPIFSDVTITCRIYVPHGGVAFSGDEGSSSYEMPSNDITSEFNNNYQYRFSGTPSLSSIKTAITFTSRTVGYDVGYGVVENTDRYYAPPDDDNIWQPVKIDSWYGGHSVWISPINVPNRTALELVSVHKINDFYLFTDVVRAVIKKIDPSIEFEANDSHFLFDNPNPLQSANPQGHLYISQKSNVLNLGYDYPAWQAPVKWSQIETFLKNALGCYWDLYEDSNGVTHLRIEHQFFYDNGGTYNPQGNPSATIDLLHNRFDVATRQPQAFHTNRWKWDVDGNGLYSSACRYEYGWMDTQSAIFDGDTIEVPEEYRLFTDDKTEERKVDWFSSDIDFLTAVQAECSSDGFVVVMESYTNPGWIVSGHENYSGQNYQLSFEYLQPLYLVYGIYAEKVQIGDGEPFQNANSARMRTAEVSFNLLEGEWVEPSDVLITEVGSGVIDTLTYDMSSEKWTATVRYNNE